MMQLPDAPQWNGPQQSALEAKARLTPWHGGDATHTFEALSQDSVADPLHGPAAPLFAAQQACPAAPQSLVLLPHPLIRTNSPEDRAQTTK
ncbi:MAG TPA: hypothetical protein VF331_17340 [Polyangiales bacterium]